MTRGSEEADATSETVTIRDVVAADEDGWRGLWAEYNAFYETVLAESVTALTWSRCLDPDTAMLSRVAVAGRDLVGFTISVVHESTWTEQPVLYLEDLFVRAADRGSGIGGALIKDRIDLCRERGLARLYWHTREDNPARALYDRFVEADGFVRYRLRFDRE